MEVEFTYFAIGSFSQSPDRVVYFTGIVDALRIHFPSASPAQIQNLFCAVLDRLGLNLEDKEYWNDRFFVEVEQSNE